MNWKFFFILQLTLFSGYKNLEITKIRSNTCWDQHGLHCTMINLNAKEIEPNLTPSKLTHFGWVDFDFKINFAIFHGTLEIAAFDTFWENLVT